MDRVEAIMAALGFGERPKMQRNVPARMSAERTSLFDNSNLLGDIDWQVAHAKYLERQAARKREQEAAKLGRAVRR